MSEPQSSAPAGQPADRPADRDRITKGQYLALFGGIGGAILTIVGNVLVHQYYQPNLRYDVGSYYRIGDMAITSVKLTNYGNSDADDIVLTAYLPEPLVRDATTDNDAVKLAILGGGKGSRNVTIAISRLVPDQRVFIYLPIKNPDGPLRDDPSAVVDQLTLKGGKGKSGLPTPFSVLLSLVFTVSSFVFTAVMIVLLRRKVKAAELEVKHTADQLIAELTERHKKELDSASESTERLVESVRAARERSLKEIEAKHKEAEETIAAYVEAKKAEVDADASKISPGSASKGERGSDANRRE